MEIEIEGLIVDVCRAKVIWRIAYRQMSEITKTFSLEAPHDAVVLILDWNETTTYWRGFNSPMRKANQVN